jgi:hypothetical protein
VAEQRRPPALSGTTSLSTAPPPPWSSPRHSFHPTHPWCPTWTPAATTELFGPGPEICWAPTYPSVAATASMSGVART